MDFILNSDGSIASLSFSIDVLIAIIIIAIPTFLICHRVSKKRMKSGNPNILYLILFSLIISIVIYVLIIGIIYIVTIYHFNL